MSAKLRWSLIIIGLLVSNALAMGFLVMASSANRPEVIPDYYAKAARFDETMEQAAQSRALASLVVRKAAELVIVVTRGAE